MARIKHCYFCGKELQKKLFHSEVRVLDKVECHYIECCEECYQEHMKFLNLYPQGDRLLIKMFNAVNLSSKDIAKQVLEYRKEFEMYKKTRGHIVLNKELTLNSASLFWYNDDGYFWVDESKGLLKETELDIEEMEEEFQKELAATEEDLRPFAFDKNDITKLQYTVDECLKEPGWYSVKIQFNDEKALTCKPCIARATISVDGPFKIRKIKGIVEETLTEFKALTDVDLSIEYVKYL